MPLHGKIVVIKRSGGDGTEFPLTAACLFGRKPDCDIRIQLPEVSKEHCRIDLNENKEVILTNLSSVNPTRVNGEALQQSERLKHGDVITIIDRSFRFEYPPAPTPKKRSSIGGKTKTFKVLQDQQVGDTVSTEAGEKRISEVSTDPHLKDGTNHDNIQRSVEKIVEVESKEGDSLLQNKTTSPFNDLYQMIKKSLDVKTPRKSSASLLLTPTSRFCTPKPVSVRKTGGNPVISSEDETNPKKDEAKVSSGPDETKEEAENKSNGTPKSVKKQRRSFQVSSEMAITEDENAVKSEATSPLKRNRVTPQRFSVCQVIEQVSTQMPRSPMRRRSKEVTPAKPAVTEKKEKQAVTSPKTKPLQKASPRNSGKFEKVEEKSQKRKSGGLAADLTQAQMKKKRVSFGGHLSPELFDKRLPPDSPLRRGATPRRSLCLVKPKQSLLRRASVIGLLQEFDQEHPESPNVRSPAKMRTPSPKKTSSAKTASPKTPTPGKKSPKSRSPSPKASTPRKKSPKSSASSPKAASPARQLPKSRSPSPKASTPGKKSPKSSASSPKAASPAKKSPKSRSTSPKASTPGKKSPKSSTSSPKAASPAKKSPKSRSTSPKAPSTGKKSKSMSPSPSRKSASKNTMETPGVQTPRREGRFSVSHIRTPSPVAEDANTDKVPLVTATPKLALRRKSMKSASRKTPCISKSAAKVMRRRSGISRVSMKDLNSWANIVKFGKTKAPVAAPAKKTTTQKTKKKAVSKPQTPARKLKDHESTGHADSPVTFVVGRAHRQKVTHPTGAAPRLVTNTALLKKNMKMDEDLTGISEMYKTPVSEMKWRSVVNDNSAMKTPVEGLGTSVVEPSVLNTPEESGEMMVSPLSVSAAVKDGRYSSEAVQRLFNVDQESSFVTDNPAMETHPDDSIEQQCTDLKTSVTTPKQKPELPECLTGVKRIMKTPRQKAEPIEDLQGRLLKTPKEKPEQQECLSGVKRIMKTPRQKAEPVEDLRGNILKTPKQKLEQQECLTGVKRIFKTPQQETEPLEDLQEKHLDTPEAPEAGYVSLDGVKETEETPAHMQDSEDLSEQMDMKTPNVKSSPSACLTGIKRIMKTPKEKSTPVEDMVGVKRLMKTPREKMEPVEENFGIKRLVKSPRLKGNPPVEDFEGLQELMEEPVTDSTGQLETNEVEDQTPQDCGVEVAKELDFAREEPRDDVPSDVVDNVAQDKMEKEADANEVVINDRLEEVPSGHDNDESSDATATISQSVVDENSPVEEPKVDSADENLSEEQPKENTEDENVSEEQATMETATDKVAEVDAAACLDPDHDKKPVRGRRAKVVESKSAEDKQEATEQTEEPVIPAPVRGRRGKKTEATAPPAVRQTGRGRNAKSQENTTDQPEIVPEKAVETTPVTETSTEAVSDQTSPTNTHQEENDAAPPAEEAVVKPTRGRKTKQTSVEPPQPEPEKNEVVSDELLMADAQPQKSVGKPRRGRKTKADTVEQNEVAEDTVVAVENKQQSQPPVRAKRGRNAKQEEEKLEMTESRDIELVTEKTVSLSSKVVLKPKRGRNAKKSSEDQVDQEVSTETDMVPEPESEQSPPPDVAENDSAAPSEKVVSKVKRGRKTKPEQSVPEQQDVPCTRSDDVLQVNMEKDANEICSDQLEVLPNGCDENKSSEAIETVPQAPATETLPEVDTATSIVPKMDPPVVEKKPVRGRRAKVVESKSAEDKQEATEQTEEPVIPAPVRGRRGKKTEATAPPAVRRTGRGRNVKSQDNTSDDQPEIVPEKAVETTPVTETSTEAVSDQTSPTNTHQEENDAAPPAEEAIVKPTRGRKTKQTSVEPPQPEPEKNEVVSDELLMADAQPQKSVGKPRRGRKTKADTVEQNEVAEDTVVAVENKQQSQPPVRAKRGRNAKQEEEKLENDTKTCSVATPKEPVKKMRRTRKAEQDHVEPSEEIQTVEKVVPEDAKALIDAEQVKMNEQATVAAKPRRGGRKAKQDTESETPVESAEVQKVTAVSSTDKQKRGRRGKQVPEKIEVTAVVPEEKPDHELKAEEKSKVEPDTPVIKRSRARGVKNEDSQATPAKRARRGAAVPNEETSAESTVLVSESVSTSVEPVKRGRRAAVKPTANDAAVTSDQTNPTEDLSSAVVEDAKMSKKSVKWKTNLEVFEIAEVTPVKAVRGRKSKLGVDTESKNVSKDAGKTEENDLSDEVVEAQPVKRTRRDAKAADVTADKDESETQPKTRRGRSAKK